MHAWQFARALGIAERHGWTRFVSMQNLVNLLYREEEREMLPLCAAEGIAVIPWSPQARGRLARDVGLHQRVAPRPTKHSGGYSQKPKMPIEKSSIASRRSRWRGDPSRAGGSRPAAGQAGHHCADCRCHQAPASRRCSRIGKCEAFRLARSHLWRSLTSRQPYPPAYVVDTPSPRTWWGLVSVVCDNCTE